MRSRGCVALASILLPRHPQSALRELAYSLQLSLGKGAEVSGVLQRARILPAAPATQLCALQVTAASQVLFACMHHGCLIARAVPRHFVAFTFPHPQPFMHAHQAMPHLPGFCSDSHRPWLSFFCPCLPMKSEAPCWLSSFPILQQTSALAGLPALCCPSLVV